VSGWNFEKFLRFLKTRPWGNVFQILLRNFLSWHQLTLFCSNFVKFGRREIREIVRYLPDQKIRLPLKLTLLRGSRQKSANNVLRVLKRFRPNRFILGGVIAKSPSSIQSRTIIMDLPVGLPVICLYGSANWHNGLRQSIKPGLILFYLLSSRTSVSDRPKAKCCSLIIACHSRIRSWLLIGDT